MNINKINIECAGYSIVADWYEGSENKNILLVLPGYSSSRTKQKDLVNSVCEDTSFSALVIDYSGHGDSPFELRDTRPAQHFLEVIYAFDWMKSRYPEATISVMGTSYGGFLATQLTKYRAFPKLVLRVPAIYKPNEFYDLWAYRIDNPDAYRGEADKYRHDAGAILKHPLLSRASSFKGKTLVVVHEKDELVPRETTDAFIKTFNADNFVAVGFSHSLAGVINERRITEAGLNEYEQKISDWLKK
ncbi:MAG TPA: alpha/beta hydrolase [Candidatus Saccharimonadales bacterium]|nr:alpha/beta hydrolase [Candidatus Saccharimonadales bacterium]